MGDLSSRQVRKSSPYENVFEIQSRAFDTAATCLIATDITAAAVPSAGWRSMLAAMGPYVVVISLRVRNRIRERGAGQQA